MIPARVSVAVADALPHASAASAADAAASDPTPAPEVAEPPEPPAQAPAPPPPSEPFPAAAPAPAGSAAPPDPAGRRPGLGGLLRRPAEYLRAYLSASVDHQLRVQAERTVDIAGAVARLEVEVANARAQSQAQSHDQALRLERLVEGLALGVSDLAHRLARMEAHGALQARTAADREAAGIARAADQLALARRNVQVGDHAVARLDQLLGVLGPRLDELEIKVRPVMEIDAESVAVRTADGYVMLPRSEPLFVTAVANATSGGLEPGVRRVLRALLRPGDACADVGANVGLLTVAMAFAVGGGGRVWAFEPEERVRAQLARTLHLNGLAQVALSGAAVGATPAGSPSTRARSSATARSTPCRPTSARASARRRWR